MSARPIAPVASVQTLAVDARDLVFEYDGRPALDSLTLTVPQGTVFGLLGPNGSGKSTLLSLLAGMHAPQAGSLRVLGEVPGPRLRWRVGVLFQESCLDPMMTVEETLRLHGKLFGLHGPDLRRNVAQLLKLVELAERVGDPTGSLSGGMKRRLELARSLLSSPSLLLLDEPTVGLDPDAKAKLWDYLRDISRQGTTLVIATNDVSEAERYFQDVAFLHRGRLLARGSPAELKRGLHKDSVRVEWPVLSEAGLQEITGWPGVGTATWSAPVLQVTVDNASSFAPRLFQAAARISSGVDGYGIRGVRIRESTLEDAYFQLVGSPIAEREELV